MVVVARLINSREFIGREEDEREARSNVSGTRERGRGSDANSAPSSD